MMTNRKVDKMESFTDEILNTSLIYGEFQKSLKKVLNKPFVIYGAGRVGQMILDVCYDSDIQLIAVCDKNKKNQPFPIIGTISDFEDIVKTQKDFQVIIASEVYYEEMKKYVLQFVNDEDIIDAKEIYSKIPICLKLLPTLEYRELISKNKDKINMFAKMLEDKKSKDTLKAMVQARLTLNLEYYKNVIEGFQYFPKDIIHLEKNEVFIDGGAFDGDTLRSFIEVTNGEYKNIYCLEPGSEQFNILQKQCENYVDSDRIILIQKALYNDSKKLLFIMDGTGSCIVDSSGDNVVEIESIAIDQFVDREVTFIKMDVEGAELLALKGSEKTIKKYKPKLAICLYHKPEDIIEIPQYIESLNLGYKYYLRHHSVDMNETVLYAI